MTTAVAAPFRFFALSATRTRRPGPSLLRVTSTGPEPAPDARVTRPVGHEGAPSAVQALRAARPPAHTGSYVRLAGEAGQVREPGRHFVGQRGTDRWRVAFTGHCRRGPTEEQLRASAA
ncbi:hypothetical protein ACIQRO_24910 [Streptomyces griseoluteus]|uniref:hypothetical protein n=1 Tax=Streptomyces griseoluteus TaxID=29306 RepID=UPI00381771C3